MKQGDYFKDETSIMSGGLEVLLKVILTIMLRIMILVCI